MMPTELFGILLSSYLAATSAWARVPILEAHVAEPIGGGLICATTPAHGTGAERSLQSTEGTAEALGEQRTLITLLNLADDPSTPYTAAQVEGEILDASNPVSTASWIQEASYGRAWITGDVVDWTTMPWSDAQQLVLVTTADWNTTTGTLRRYERDGASWREVGSATPIAASSSASAAGGTFRAAYPGSSGAAASPGARRPGPVGRGARSAG